MHAQMLVSTGTEIWWQLTLLHCAPQLAGPSSIGVNHVVNHQGFIGHLASTPSRRRPYTVIYVRLKHLKRCDLENCAVQSMPSLQAVDQEKTHLVRHRATNATALQICSCQKKQNAVWKQNTSPFASRSSRTKAGSKLTFRRPLLCFINSEGKNSKKKKSIPYTSQQMPLEERKAKASPVVTS